MFIHEIFRLAVDVLSVSGLIELFNRRREVGGRF